MSARGLRCRSRSHLRVRPSGSRLLLLPVTLQTVLQKLADSQPVCSGAEHPPLVSNGTRTGSRCVVHGVVVASVVVGMWLLVFHVSPRPVWHHTFDLRVYRGAVRWWLDGRPVYDFVRPGSIKGFTYPPFAALVLLPLALGTETTATVLLSTVSAVLVVLVTWWLVAPVAAR